MSASYGRPQPRKVNALFDPGQPSQARGIDRQVVNVTPNGRLQDFTSVDIAGRNAERGFNEIANFLDNAVEAAKPVYDAYLKNEVDKELGMVAAQPEMVQAYRDGDEKSRAWISRFRPQTQFYVNKQAAEAAAVSYGERDSTLASTNPILRDSTSTEEELLEARKAIKAQAFEESGLANVEPRALGAVGGRLQQVDQVIKVNLAAARDKDAKNIQDSKIIAGVGVSLADATLIQLERDNDQATPESLNEYKKAKTSYWQTKIKELEENRTSTETAELFLRGTLESSTAAFGTGEDKDVDTGMALLDEAWFAVNDNNIKTGNGQILGQVVVTKDGKTLRQVIAERRRALQPLRDQAEVRALYRSLAPYAQQLMGVSTNEAMTFLLNNVKDENGRVDLTMINEIWPTISTIVNAGNTPTNAQLGLEREFQVRMRQAGKSAADIQAIQQEVNNADLTAAQKLRLAQYAGGGSTQTGRINTAEQSTKEEARLMAESLAEAGKDKGQEVSAADREIQLRSRAKEIQDEKVNKFLEQNGGKDMLDDDYVREYRDSLKQAFEEEVEQIDASKSQAPQTPEMRMSSELATIEENISNFAAEGKPTKIREIFSPEFREQARKNGIKDTYKALTTYLLNTLAKIQTKDGKPAFPNAPDAWFRMRKRAESAAPQNNQNISAPSSDAPKSLIEQLIPGIKTRGNGEGDQSSVQPLEFVGNALASLVGGRPAVAGTLEGKPGIDNPDALSQLAAVVSGSQDVSLQTPALPQAPANAPAQAVPAQIKTDTHPFFLAIGINEGTRTPDGGYTRAYYGHEDPGNGARNVGTVSSQQHSNPEVADRVYAGRLSALSTRLTPVLMKMGLQTGTVAFNRLMFNLLDLTIQAPLAADDLLGNLRGDLSIEGIAKARADSFINPATGRLEAAGFGNSYNRLFTDQRSRAGAFDYKARF